jgi:hypothetical protein
MLMRTSAVPPNGCNSLRDMRIAVAQLLLATGNPAVVVAILNEAAVAILRTSEGLNARESRHLIAQIEDAISPMRS